MSSSHFLQSGTSNVVRVIFLPSCICVSIHMVLIASLPFAPVQHGLFCFFFWCWASKLLLLPTFANFRRAWNWFRSFPWDWSSKLQQHSCTSSSELLAFRCVSTSLPSRQMAQLAAVEISFFFVCLFFFLQSSQTNGPTSTPCFVFVWIQTQ